MYRQISIWKRVIYGMLAAVMVLTSCNWGTIFAAAAALGNSGTFQVGFGAVTSNGATLTPETNDGVGSFYMIQKQQQFFHRLCLRAESGTDAAVFVLGRQRRFGTGEQLGGNSFCQTAGRGVYRHGSKAERQEHFRQCDNSL